MATLRHPGGSDLGDTRRIVSVIGGQWCPVSVQPTAIGGRLSYRDALLIFHIAGAGTWLGANVVQAVVPTAAARVGVEALAGWYRVTSVLAKRLYMPAATIILVTGVLLVLDSPVYGFASTFVTIGFGMILVSALLGVFVFAPGGESAAEAVESGDPGRIRSAVASLGRWGMIDTLLLLLTITVMVLRLE